MRNHILGNRLLVDEVHISRRTGQLSIHHLWIPLDICKIRCSRELHSVLTDTHVNF